MAQQAKKNDDGVSAGAIAAGVLAAGAAAAAGYYFYGAKHATRHRKEAVKWAHDMKTDIVKEAKRFQGLGEEVMHDAVDRVAERYRGSGVDAAAVEEVVRELKSNWKRVRQEASGKKRAVSAGKRIAKKVGKKAAKKSAKKRTRKSA